MGNSRNVSALKCPQCGANLSPGAGAFLLCQYCGASLVWQGAGAQEGQSAAGGEPPRVARGYRLKRVTCTDSAGTGLEVFHLLAPDGWNFQGGVQWLLDNPGMPAVVAFQVANPDGPEAFEVLPNMNFIYNNSPLAHLTAPVGSHSFGAEVRAPVSIRDALRQYVLPRYRSMVSDLRILREEPQPDLPRLAKSEAAISPIGSAEGGRVRVSYSWQGQPFEEEIYAVVEVFRTPMMGGFGASQLAIWFIDFLFSFRAAAGRLDSLAELYLAMISSLKTNPEWYAAFKSVAQVMAQQQIQRIRHIGQIGQMYAQAGREMREQNLNDWYARQATYDRLATDFSRQIRDVDAYFDPNRGEAVELPAGYGHAWATPGGEYIVTADPNFNPNERSNLNWTELPAA